jgi:guanylate kinase
LKIPEPQSSQSKENYPLLIILSGPSGVGKDSIISGLKILNKDWYFAITATTRARRPEEFDGVDYFFLSTEKFSELLSQEEFLEYAEVYGNWYGVPKTQIKEAIEKGIDVVIKIDVQGASTIKGLVPDGLFIFLVPPSIDELENRLRSRHTESPEELKIRIETAAAELNQAHLFDYVVTNNTLEEAISNINSIVAGEKARGLTRRISL